jgi:hypothetical protein
MTNPPKFLCFGPGIDGISLSRVALGSRLMELKIGASCSNQTSLRQPGDLRLQAHGFASPPHDGFAISRIMRKITYRCLQLGAVRFAAFISDSLDTER